MFSDDLESSSPSVVSFHDDVEDELLETQTETAHISAIHRFGELLKLIHEWDVKVDFSNKTSTHSQVCTSSRSCNCITLSFVLPPLPIPILLGSKKSHSHDLIDGSHELDSNQYQATSLLVDCEAGKKLGLEADCCADSRHSIAWLSKKMTNDGILQDHGSFTQTLKGFPQIAWYIMKYATTTTRQIKLANKSLIIQKKCPLYGCNGIGILRIPIPSILVVLLFHLLLKRSFENTHIRQGTCFSRNSRTWGCNITLPFSSSTPKKLILVLFNSIIFKLLSNHLKVLKVIFLGFTEDEDVIYVDHTEVTELTKVRLEKLSCLLGNKTSKLAVVFSRGGHCKALEGIAFKDPYEGCGRREETKD
ncbi:hypothetical protein Q3G72_007113 [Acer saccharum]|nr:hypothetical protein Q3G72_007113 [Acer saccharum]